MLWLLGTIRSSHRGVLQCAESRAGQYRPVTTHSAFATNNDLSLALPFDTGYYFDIGEDVTAFYAQSFFHLRKTSFEDNKGDTLYQKI
jgi:hypothetical protein